MRRHYFRGFTFVELLIVVAILAIVLAVVAPSFQGLLAGKRVEGVAAELATDLQFARSEAVSRSASVRVTFPSATCYIVHTGTALSTCVTSGTGLIKTVQIDSGNTSFTSYPAFISFESVRGTAETSGSIVVGSTASAAQVRINLNDMGRVQTCSPSGTVKGLTAC